MNRYIISIIVMLLLVGCSELYDESLGLYPTLTPRYITVTPTLLTYTSSAETQSINITSTQTPWKTENGITWVSLAPTSGDTSGTISVGVSENTVGDEARTGIFYLKSGVIDWKYETPISVTQAGATPFITLSKTAIDFTGAENNETITVSSNCSWTISSSHEWLVVTRKDNTISLSAKSNETNSYRTATVSVIHEGKTILKQEIYIRKIGHINCGLWNVLCGNFLSTFSSSGC